jgi:hypothetical protein
MSGDGDLENLNSPILPSNDPAPAEGKTEYDGHYSKAAIARREEFRRRGLTVLQGGGEPDPHLHHPSRRSIPINPATGGLKLVPDDLLRKQIESDS